MRGPRPFLLVAVALLGMLVQAAEVSGHTRRRGEPPRPAAIPPPAPPVLTTTSAPLGQNPEALPMPPSATDLEWQFNASPCGPEAPQILLGLARAARTEGQVMRAQAAYQLAGLLFPHTPAAQLAQKELTLLNFYQELGVGSPLAACRRLLEQTLAPGSWATTDASLQAALRAGWRAVEVQMSQEKPVPPSLVEELLKLWELHPPGTRPPEAALLLAQVLQERGLAGEAQHFLSQVLGDQDPFLQTRAVIALLELSWMTQGLPGFLATLTHLHEEPRQVRLALRTWPLRLAPGGPGQLTKVSPEEGATPVLRLSAVQRRQIWEELGGQVLPPALAAYILHDLAVSGTDGGRPAPDPLYQLVLEKAKEDLGPGYYYDRVGLRHLRQGYLETAQEAFQAAAQDEDPLWRHLARVRLLDLELARGQLPASP